MAYAVAVCVDGDGVEEGDAEAVAQIRRATGRCARGAEYAGQVILVRFAKTSLTTQA